MSSVLITQTLFAILRTCDISDAYESEEMDVDLYVYMPHVFELQ